MSYEVKGTTINLTRGDTFASVIRIYHSNGKKVYTPVQGDTIRFAMKKDINDKIPLILKDIPIDSMMLVIDPEDTKPLAYGKYYYDIEITTADGNVCTFITKSVLNLTEEVH